LTECHEPLIDWEILVAKTIEILWERKKERRWDHERREKNTKSKRLFHGVNAPVVAEVGGDIVEGIWDEEEEVVFNSFSILFK
jgi:hypothetical protein